MKKKAKPKTGRPPIWPEELRPTAQCTATLPVVLRDLLKNSEFKKRFIALMLDFVLKKY